MTFNTVPIGMVFSVANGATPKSGELELWDGDVPWVTPADLGKNRGPGISRGSRSITRKGLNSCGTQLVPVGSIIVSIRAPIGHTAVATEPMCFNQGCRGLIPSTKVLPNFGYWAILALIPTLRAEGQGTTFQELGRDKLRAIKIPLPDLETQRQIADFLDRETARIDLLIEKKQRLVVLLGEKLRSAITDALSTGFDRAAPMQSTGLTWLPEVPAHWTVPPLRTLIWYQEGPGILAVDFHNEGIPLLRIKGLSGRYATLNGCNFLDPDKVKTRWKHFRVEVGDYLISASATTGGIATEVTEETAGAVPYTGIIRIKPRRGGYVREIIPYFLLSTLFEEQITLLSAGSTIQHFGPSHLSHMKAPLPPKQEQIQIAQRLYSAMSRTEEATQKVKTSIDRLKEYRSALITAAVTGQIDVQTYGKSGAVDRRLDAIQEEMEA